MFNLRLTLFLLILQLTNFFVPSIFSINTRLEYFFIKPRFKKRINLRVFCLLLLVVLISLSTLILNPMAWTTVVLFCLNSTYYFFLIDSTRKRYNITSLIKIFIFLNLLIISINILFLITKWDFTTLYINGAYLRSSLYHYNDVQRSFFPFIEPRQLGAFTLFSLFLGILSNNLIHKFIIIGTGLLVITLSLSTSAFFGFLILLIGSLVVTELKEWKKTILLLASIISLTLLIIFVFSDSIIIKKISLPNYIDIKDFFADPFNNRITGYGWDTYITGLYIFSKLSLNETVFGIGFGATESFARELGLRRLGAIGFVRVAIEAGFVGVIFLLVFFIDLYKRLVEHVSRKISSLYLLLLSTQMNVSEIYFFTVPLFMVQTALFINHSKALNR